MESALTLEQTYQLLNLAVVGGRMGAWYWYLDTNRLEWSGLCREYLALPPDAEPSFEHFWAVLHPEDRQRVEGLIAGAIRDKSEHYQAECRIVGPNGTIRWLSAPGRVFLDAHGHAYAMAGILMDITERKSTETRLQETLALFQSLFERAPIGIAITDTQGRFERCNPAYESLLGYTEAELCGREFIELIHPEDREANLVEVRRVASGASDSFVIENRYLHKDGRPIWARKLGSVLSGDGESPTRFLSLVSDITGRREAEERLAESRECLDLALAGSEMGAWSINIASGQVRHDESSLSLLGYWPDEPVMTLDGWTRLIHPYDVPLVNAAVRAHLEGSTRICEAEFRLRHQEGHWVWILARGKVRYDAAGHPVRAAGTYLDITDRKRLVTEGTDLLRRIEMLINSLDRKPAPEPSPSVGSTSGMICLSPRLREVLALVAEGLTSVQIAQRLGISNETAITHRRNLMRKLGLRNKAELIRYALQHEHQVL